MTSYTETKIVALTSQSATIKYNNSYLSNVYYGLGSIFNNDANIIHKQVQLLNAQIPYSFYVINYTNNQFKYQLGSGTVFTSSIPVGNYTGNSLITALKAALTANSITLTIVLSSIDGKITFTHVSSNFTFYDIMHSILETLGFEANTNYTSASFTLTPPYPLNLLGIKTLQIRSTNLVMSNISSVQGGQTTLLATVPVDCTPFGMINYADKGNNLMTIYNDSLDDLAIEIIDGESSEFINFNNQDWCITLAFHLTRSFEPIERPTFQSLGRSKLELQEGAKVAEPPTDELKEKEGLASVPSKDMQELNLLSQ
jgi:hypothetical protein